MIEDRTDNTSEESRKLAQREAELALINSVQKGLLEKMEIQDIYELVGEKIRELFDAQVAVVSTFNYENQTEQFHYAFEDGKRHDLDPRPIDTFRQKLIDTAELICINENADAMWKKITGEEPTVAPGTKLTKSALYVPMAAGDTVFGYISLQNVDREHAFSDSDVQLLNTLANSISIALENARLFSETEQRNAELGVINSVQEGLVAEMDLQGIYDLVGERIRDLFDSQVTVIAVFDHDNQKEEFRYVFEDGKRLYPAARIYDEIRKYLIQNKEKIHINSDAIDEVEKYGASIEAAPGTVFPKSMVYVPLILSDQVKGYVSLQNLDKEHAFSDSDVRLLSTLANSMSVALENARLFDETEQRNAELAVINSVQEGLVAEMDLQGIYDLVGDRIRDLFDAQVASIATFDHENNTERFQYYYEDGKRFYPEERSYDKIRNWLIQNKKLLLVNEDADETIYQITGEGKSTVPGTRLPKSVLFVPMVIGDDVRGYVSLQNLDHEHAFPESDVRLLSTLANSMSVALENARLFNETEQRNAELAVINSVQQGLVAEMDMQGIYDLVGDRIRDLFDAPAAGIYSFDIEAGLEHFEYLYEDGERLYPDSRPLDKIRKWLIENKRLLLVNEDADETIYQITGEGKNAVPGTRLPKSLIFVPLIVGDDVRGCVSLQNLDHEHAFPESDVRLLSTLANSMSVALENARLFDETEQRNAELAVINSVQEGLVAEMELQGIYDLVGDRLRDLFDAQVAAIATFDLEKETEQFHYIFENGERFYPEPRKYDKIRQRLISSQKMILINEDAKSAYRTITGEAPKAVSGTSFPKSMVFAPLIIADSVRGYVTLQNLDKEHAFSDSDISLLGTLANSMSVALENARLFNETEQRNAELAVINSVQQGLVAEMDLQGIYDLVGDRIRDLFNAQIVSIATFDHENTIEHFQYCFEKNKRIYPESRRMDNFRKKLIETKELFLINENFPERAEEFDGKKPEPLPGTKLPKSVLFVPMVIGDDVRGYVSLQNLDHEHAFPESDVRLLSTLANSMTVALENARLFNETEQRNAELAVINSVQKGLVAEMDMQGIYDLVGDRIRDLFDAQVTGIVTFNHSDKTEHFQYIYEDGERVHPPGRPYDNVRAKLIHDRQKLLFNEKASEAMSEINGKPFKPVPGTRMAQSALYVPMSVGKEVLGYVSLQNLDREHAFSESDVRLLSTLINSMSVAIENARLFNETTRLLKETEQRNAELAVINSVQDGLVREMDMQAIYNLVGEKICDVLNTQTMIIRTFDHENKLEHWQYAIEKGKHIEVEPRPFIWANKILIETKEHLLINEEYEKIAVEYEGTAVTKGLAPKSAIFVPMIVGDTVVGSVSLQNVEEEHAFSESDLQLIKTLTNSMSVAIENARLFNETTRLLAETEQRAAEMQTVNSISRALVSQLEFDKLIELVGEQMKKTFKADIVYLALHDRESNMLNFPYYYGDEPQSRPFGNGITEKIILKKEPLLINQNLDEAYHKIKAEKKGEMVESYLGVPIMAGSEAIGVISVQSKEQENRFNENDLRLLTTIAANVGVAMQNAEAYQNLQEALTELKSAQEQLVRQEKLASLGQLTAGIAHEIKNPLNFVNNFSELSIELVDEVRDEIRQMTDDRRPAGPEKENEENPLLRGDGIAEGDARGVSDGAENKDLTRNTETDSSSANPPLNPTDSWRREFKNHDYGLILDILNDIEANLSKIHEHGTRADGIVKSMLLHSRGKSGEHIPTDLNKLLDEYVKLSYHGMRAVNKAFNIDMQFHFDDSVGVMDLVAQDLSRAFLNIINNAMYATYDYSKTKVDHKPVIKVSTKHAGNRVEIRIRDNGPGIPDEIREKIFEPFFTTKPTGEGTGLGLSMTHDIIKLHQGNLDVETEPGAFTEFIITLPITNQS